MWPVFSPARQGGGHDILGGGSLSSPVRSRTPSCTTHDDVIIRFIRFLLLQQVQQRPPRRRHCSCYSAHEVFALHLLAFKRPTPSSSEVADRPLAVTQAPALWMLAFDTVDKSKKAGGLYTYIYIYIYISLSIYLFFPLSLSLYIYIYICIHTYTYRFPGPPGLGAVALFVTFRVAYRPAEA